jgi:hypothetical protein
MILLRSFDKYNRFADFDPQTGQLRERSARSLGGPQRFQGFFTTLGGQRIALYRASDGIHVHCQDKDFELSRAHVDRRREGQQYLLDLSDANGSVVSVRYSPPALYPPLEMDPTAFVEEEDFDFGLLLSNISKDPVRQSRMFPTEVQAVAPAPAVVHRQ